MHVFNAFKIRRIYVLDRISYRIGPVNKSIEKIEEEQPGRFFATWKAAPMKERISKVRCPLSQRYYQHTLIEFVKNGTSVAILKNLLGKSLCPFNEKLELLRFWPNE